MKTYYSKFFKKSKIRRKATLSALDLGEKFSYSSVSNSRIISKLSAYSEWKKTGDCHDRDVASLEDALVKDFIALVNQNLMLSQKHGETNDLHARIIQMEEQVRISSGEKANIAKEYKVLDSNYKFLSLKNEQLSNYCANLQAQLQTASNGQIDLKEYRKSNELEFICHKLQKRLDALEKENSALKVGSHPPAIGHQNELNNVRVLTLGDLPKKNVRTNNKPFRVPKVENDLYDPCAVRGSSGSDVSEASAQTDIGCDIIKLEHAYSRLKEKNKELAKTLELFKDKVTKDCRSTDIEGGNVNQISDLKPHLGLNTRKVNNSMESKDPTYKTLYNDMKNDKNVDPNLIILITEIENRDTHIMKLKDEYRTLEKVILERDQDMITMRNEYQNMEQALKTEIELNGQDLIKLRNEYQELLKAHDRLLNLEDFQSLLGMEKEKMVKLAAEKDALERQLDSCLKEISTLKDEQKENWNMTMMTEGNLEAELSQKVSDFVNQLELETTKNTSLSKQNTELEIRLNAAIDGFNEQMTNREELLSTARRDYQDLSSSNLEIERKNHQLNESLLKLQTELDALIAQNKDLIAEKDDLQNLVSVSQKEILALKHKNEDLKQSVPSDQFIQLQIEYNASKNIIVSLEKEITKYCLDTENLKAEYQKDVVHRDRLVSDLRNDCEALKIDFGEELKALNTRIISAQDEIRSLKAELDVSKSEYLKLSKEHEEAIRSSAEKDLRMKETFAAFANLSSQLKSEQSQRVDLEKKLSDELKVSLDKRNSFLYKAQSEYKSLESQLKASEEKLFALAFKYEELESEMQRKDLEYKEDIEEADSNFEKLLKKYEDLSKKAAFLETIYTNAQSEFPNNRQHIIR